MTIKNNLLYIALFLLSTTIIHTNYAMGAVAAARAAVATTITGIQAGRTSLTPKIRIAARVAKTATMQTPAGVRPARAMTTKATQFIQEAQQAIAHTGQVVKEAQDTGKILERILQLVDIDVQVLRTTKKTKRKDKPTAKKKGSDEAIKNMELHLRRISKSRFNVIKARYTKEKAQSRKKTRKEEFAQQEQRETFQEKAQKKREEKSSSFFSNQTHAFAAGAGTSLILASAFMYKMHDLIFEILNEDYKIQDK